MKKKSNHVVYDEASIVPEINNRNAWKYAMNNIYGSISHNTNPIIASTPRQLGKTNSYKALFDQWVLAKEQEKLREQRLKNLDIIQLEKNPRKSPVFIDDK